jgi:hypothetical protein
MAEPGHDAKLASTFGIGMYDPLLNLYPLLSSLELQAYSL